MIAAPRGYRSFYAQPKDMDSAAGHIISAQFFSCNALLKPHKWFW